MKWTTTQNDAVHSGGNANVFQVILCFSFGSISLDGKHDTLLRSPSECTQQARIQAHTIVFICTFDLSQWRTRCIALSLLSFNYKETNIRSACMPAMKNRARYKFYSKYQFHFYFTLEIWRNRLGSLFVDVEMTWFCVCAHRARLCVVWKFRYCWISLILMERRRLR